MNTLWLRVKRSVGLRLLFVRLSLRYRPRSPKRYGAILDGIADDHEAINRQWSKGRAARLRKGDRIFTTETLNFARGSIITDTHFQAGAHDITLCSMTAPAILRGSVLMCEPPPKGHHVTGVRITPPSDKVGGLRVKGNDLTVPARVGILTQPGGVSHVSEARFGPEITPYVTEPGGELWIDGDKQ